MSLRSICARIGLSNVLFGCAFGAVAFTAVAQVPPPVFPAIDENGVDVATGRFNLPQTDVAIGQPGAGGLAYTRYSPEGGHNHWGYISNDGTSCYVVIGNHTETFNMSSGSCTTSKQQVGSTLSYSGGQYTYTMRDGTVVLFQNIPLSGFMGFLQRITAPTGDITNYLYDSAYETVCIPDPENCWGQETYFYIRLSTVSTNAGYILFFQYPAPVNSTYLPNKVTAANRAVEYCTGANCSASWPSATYTYTGTLLDTVTDMTGMVTDFDYSGAGQVSAIKFPDNASHRIDISYYGAGANIGRVQTLNRGFGSWSYSYSDASGQRTATVTAPDTGVRVYNSTIATGRINSFTNELSKVLSYQYDGNARQTRVTQPEGNYAQYTYDARGNVTQIRQVSKTPGTPADIVTSAAFPASCSNTKTCNKPDSSTDARGFRTDYTYDSTHGGTLTVTPSAPAGSAPVGSGTRPQVRYTYSSLQAYYKTSVSTWGNGTAVWRPTATRACAVSASCTNAAEETVTTVSYPGVSTPNNVLPSSTTTRAGDSSVSLTTATTYNGWGDIDTVDGPLATAVDSTRYYYSAGRRLVGVVGPDPDAGGPRLYRAVRTAYNSIGQPTVVERGTVTSQSDSAFSSFALLEKQDTLYDSYARPSHSRLWNGGTVVAQTQFSYDSRGRPECTAQRMNSAAFGGAPGACTLGTTGSLGADRITRTTYNLASSISQVESAYGTGLVQTTQAYTYTNNGQVLTLTNARNYRTTYEYDGFDRLYRRYYPSPTTTGQSSLTDYEQFSYDAGSNVTQERRRSTDTFSLTYDNLNRVTLRDAPGAQPDVSMTYDLLSRRLTASQSGNTLTTAYNALSRVTSVASSVLGTVSYGYDAAGRRNQVTYPGSFYVTYAYNSASDLTGILESGSTSLATYAYDDLGRRTSLTRGNGVVTSYTFDAISRLNTLAQNAAGTSHDTTFTFAYNPANQITSRTRTNSVFDWVLPAAYSESYTPNGLNQYTSARGASPTYDTRGNLTGDGTKTYGYDYDNRVTSASGGVTLGYDPAGRLHQIAGGSTTRFLYDGTDLIAEYNTGGTVLRRFVHGPGADEPLLWYEGSGTGDKRYLMADERGSVIGITDGSGAVTQVNKYDAYGVPHASNQGRFQYTGQTWLSDLALYHYKARIYHPKLGRFLQTDPIGVAGGMNLYAYTSNDPTNQVDPAGLDGESIEEIIVTGTRTSSCDAVCQNNRRDMEYIHQVLSFWDSWARADNSSEPSGEDGNGSLIDNIVCWLPPANVTVGASIKGGVGLGAEYFAEAGFTSHGQFFLNLGMKSLVGPFIGGDAGISGGGGGAWEDHEQGWSRSIEVGAFASEVNVIGAGGEVSFGKDGGTVSADIGPRTGWSIGGGMTVTQQRTYATQPFLCQE